METLQKICADVAGGFTEQGSPCIVTITTTDSDYTNTLPVQSSTPTGSPEETMKRLADEIGTVAACVKVHVFVMCGGMDGSRMTSK